MTAQAAASDARKNIIPNHGFQDGRPVIPGIRYAHFGAS
jgi:hypothetical protein